MMRGSIFWAGVVAAGLALVPSEAPAQAWDTGRNMFGFAQYYPGSGWSSFYHPDFDPQAFFPTTFGLRSAQPSGWAAPPGAAGRGGAWSQGRHGFIHDRVLRRRRR